MGTELLGLTFPSMRVKPSQRSTKLGDEDRFPKALFEDLDPAMPEDDPL